MRFNNKNITPGQYVNMYRRGGNIRRFQEGNEMDPGMYDPNANIYSPDWQMDENVQLYEEPTEETTPPVENTNNDESQFPFDNTDPAATEVVCQMCDGGYPVNLPPNPDGTCPPGSTIDDGQTNPCDQNTDDPNVENQDPKNQDPQADVKSGHRQKYGSKGTIPDWLTAAPVGDKGNLADLILTTRSIINSYKPENKKGKFSLYNLPSGYQEGGEEGGPAPLEADYNFINAGGCQGGGCAANPYTDAGASAFVGVEGSNLEDALLQGGLKSHVGYTGNSGLGINASGELGAQTNLMDATEGAMDPELFYKGKLKAGYTGEPIVMGNAEYQGVNLGGYGEYDSNSGMNVGLEGGYGPLSVRGGYNVDTGSPFLGAGLNIKFRDGGDLPKAQMGYFDNRGEGVNYYGDPAYSFGPGQAWSGEDHQTKILTYDELNNYLETSQAENPREDFINSEKPNVILTHDNAPDWFDNRAVWTGDSRPGWEEQVKQKIYSGEWGYNPATGALVRLANISSEFGGGNVEVHPDKAIIATKEFHDAGVVRLPDDPKKRKEWIKKNKKDIINITFVPTGMSVDEIMRLGDQGHDISNIDTSKGYYQAYTYSGSARRRAMLSEPESYQPGYFERPQDFDSVSDLQFQLDSLLSDPNADPIEITNLKLKILNEDAESTYDWSEPVLMDTTSRNETRYHRRGTEATEAPILSFQPGGEHQSDVSTSITLDEEGARPRIDASVPIASTVSSGSTSCYAPETGEISAACEIEGGVEFDPSTSTITTPDQVNEYTVPTGNQPYSDTNVYDADGDGQITPHDAIYAQNNPLPTEETVTETIPGTTKNKLSMNPTFNIGAKGNLGYTSPGGLHIGGTGRVGVMGTNTQDINPYFSARGDIGYVGDNFALTGFGEHGNIKGTDVGLRGSANLGGVDLFGEGRYNINTGGPSFTAGVRIPFAQGGSIPVWALPQLQTGGAAQGGYVWEWSPENPDPLLMNNQQMIGPQNQSSAPPNQTFPYNEPVQPGNVPPMQDADNDGISDFVDADSGSEPVYGPENAPQPESNIEPGTYDPDIYTFNQPELDEAVDTQDNVEYYEPEDTTPPDADDTTDSSFPFDNEETTDTEEETDPGMDENMDENMDDTTDESTDEVVNPDPGDDSPEGDTTEEDTSSDDDDDGAVDEGGGKSKGAGSGIGETITKTMGNVVKAGKFLNAWMERRNAKKEKEKLMHKTVADNMFEADEADISGQKGDYDTNSGIFRPDDKVSTIRKGRYGGALPQFKGGGYDFGPSSLHTTRKSLETGKDAYASEMGVDEGLDYIQTGLTAGGLTPGWGIFADVPNAIISGGRAGYAWLTGNEDDKKKHLENLAINSTSAIPGPIGWGAGGAGLTKDLATYSGLREDQSLYSDVQGIINPDETQDPSIPRANWTINNAPSDPNMPPIDQPNVTKYGGSFQPGGQFPGGGGSDPFQGYNYDINYWNEPGTHSYGKTEDYANWYSGGDGHGTRVLDSEGNPTHFRKGAWEGHYSGQQWSLDEPLNFSEEDYKTLINTMQYNPKLLDRKGQTRRVKNTFPGNEGGGPHATYDHNRHIDDYVAFKEVMERNSGHEWNDMQLADAAYALRRRGTRGGWGSGVNQQPIFAEGLPSPSAYRNDPSIWGDYGDAIYADRIENPGGIPENSTMANINNIVQANATTQPTRGETPISIPSMPANQLETSYVPELPQFEQASVEQQPVEQEAVEEESAYVPQSQRGEYVPQSQRNQDPVEEEIVEEEPVVEEEIGEETEDDMWARRKAKRAAMFAREGGQVVDIDFKTYRELIAAGAELEIV